MGLVVPAVLPSSRKDLEEKLELFTRISSISRIQIDVVDGRFVTPPSWPYTAPKELAAMVTNADMLPRLENVEYEIDLMCLNPEKAAESWLALGATRLTFHAESVIDLPRLFANVRQKFGSGDGFAPGLISFGIALNIQSDIALIEQVINEISYVQFMGIARIGLQGQPFDRSVLEKIRLFYKRYPACPIQVDGGISLSTAQEVITLGASQVVVGSALLRVPNPAHVYAEFEALRSSYGV